MIDAASVREATHLQLSCILALEEHELALRGSATAAIEKKKRRSSSAHAKTLVKAHNHFKVDALNRSLLKSNFTICDFSRW